MQSKAVLLASLSSLLSLTINLLLHHYLLSSLLNCLTLGLSVYLFQIYLNQIKSLFNTFLIISLGLIPLFHYSPDNQFTSFLPLLSLGFFYLYEKMPTKYLVIIIFGFFLFLGNIYLSEIIKHPFRIQYTQLIFNSPEINLYMYRHQQDALFIPYKIRLVAYSKLIYVYAFLTNLFNFLNLKNLSDILLVANLYPFFTGIFYFLKQKNRYRDIFFIAFLITDLTIGIDRSTDRFKSLYLLGPIFVYIIFLGAKNVNKKLYLILWIISLFILISPKI